MEMEIDGQFPLEVQEHVSMLVDDTPDEVVHVTTTEEKQKLINESEFLIVKIGAVWCGPCEKVMPGFKQLALEYKDTVVFASEDVDDELDLYPEPIKTIPVFHFYVKGEYVDKFLGTNLEELESKIKKII
jgi:thioredoxin 1